MLYCRNMKIYVRVFQYRQVTIEKVNYTSVSISAVKHWVFVISIHVIRLRTYLIVKIVNVYCGMKTKYF